MDKYTIPAKKMTNKMDTIAFKALFNEVLHKTDEFDEETPYIMRNIGVIFYPKK